MPKVANAFNFAARAPSGQWLYYNIISDSTVSVTYPDRDNQPWGKYHDPISGDLIIPDSVESNGVKYAVTWIGYQAFSGCPDLTSVIIPEGVTTIWNNAFLRCYGLTSVSIPSTVTNIGNSAFQDCRSLTSVIIRNGTSYGTDVFNGCYSLSDVTIEEGVTSLATRIFSSCTTLVSVVIPSTVTSIGASAFAGCRSLDPTTIPSGVTNIGSNAFYNVRNVFYYGSASDATGGNWGALHLNCYQQDSLIYNNRGKTQLVGAYRDVHNRTIPSTVKVIADNAFSGCHNITEITIPAAVNYIGDGAFANCANLSVVNFLPDSCTYMGLPGNSAYPYRTTAFSGCSALSTINIGNNVKLLTSYAFFNCTGLTSISIPPSVKYMGYAAFGGCVNLQQTNYNGSIEGWCNIVWDNSTANPISQSHNLSINGTPLQYLEMPLAVSTVNSYAFYSCQSITGALTIPNHIFSIGDSAFAKCTGLSSLIFNASNCTSATNAFGGCPNIAAIIIGNSVTNIPNYTFSGCSGVTQMTVNRSTPPMVYQYSFQNIPQYIPVYVPCNSMTSYYDNPEFTYWLNFTNIEEMCESIMVTVSSSDATMGSVTGSGNYSIGDTVMLTAFPYAGYRFTHWSNGSQDNPLPFVVNEALLLTAVFGDIPNYDTLFVHDTTYVTIIDTTYINIHDTTYIDVPYAVHDTTYISVPVHDTTYVDVHDTTYITVPVHDTTIVTDTVTLTEYVPVHDTTYVDVHDTTYINVPVHDTTVVTDTVTLTEYVAVHDTTYVDVHDTAYIDVPVHDTIVVTDTVTLTEYVTVHDTTYVPVYDTTIVTVPVHDTTVITEYIHDTTTVTEYVHDTTTVYNEVHDTVWLTEYIHDTVYIYDTIVVGLNEVDAINAKVYSDNGQIVVEGADGYAVTLYDLTGRYLATKQDYGTVMRFDVPASGTYMIKIGNHPVRKVVVIR